MLQSVTKYSSYLTHGWGITSKPKKPIYKYQSRLSAGQHHLKRISKKGEHVRIRSATDAGRLREREPLLTLRKYCHEIIADSFYQSTGITNYDEMLTMPHNEPTLLSPIHVVLKRRRDLMDTPVHQGFDDSEDSIYSNCNAQNHHTNDYCLTHSTKCCVRCQWWSRCSWALPFLTRCVQGR